MINSRKIEDLHPTVQKMCNDFIKKCADVGIDILITSTYRDLASQAEIYAQGRTKPGKKVTNAPAGKSFHNWKVAFDFCPVKNGKAMWSDTATFERCGVIAESCGLEWAGRWRTMKELAHCQYTGGLTLVDFNNGKMIA